jgi:NAD(P)-dependent dehydrogenase (short-subunit alcohol dehydrogenase family)
VNCAAALLLARVCAGGTIIKNTPFGRFGDAEELVGPLIMLASNAGSFCTGVRC